MWFYITANFSIIVAGPSLLKTALEAVKCMLTGIVLVIQQRRDTNSVLWNLKTCLYWEAKLSCTNAINHQPIQQRVKNNTEEAVFHSTFNHSVLFYRFWIRQTTKPCTKYYFLERRVIKTFHPYHFSFWIGMRINEKGPAKLRELYNRLDERSRHWRTEEVENATDYKRSSIPYYHRLL